MESLRNRAIEPFEVHSSSGSRAQWHNGPIPQTSLRRSLLSWFRRQARPLPWRRTRSPYAIWVSEVMLQQTQVGTVIPYYLRFLRAFPTVRRLACARLDRVFELWSGLGYYRRARNLHRAARLIVCKFGGRFPPNYRQARSLPGIGDYTARAILSIAFDQPFAVLDGNVARVVARLKALRGNVNQPAFRSAIERALDQWLSRRRPGNFNQAIMELGQTLCLPRAPRCPACPLRKWCKGYRSGDAVAYPEPRPRRATESHFLATAILRRGRRVALVRGLDDGLLTDLWNFPAAFGTSPAVARRRLREKLSTLIAGTVKFGTPLAEVRHIITHRSIRVRLYPVAAPAKFLRHPLRWFPADTLDRTAVSQLARKISGRIGTRE